VTTKTDLQAQLDAVKSQLNLEKAARQGDVDGLRRDLTDARGKIEILRGDLNRTMGPSKPRLSIKFVGGYMDGQKHAIPNDRFPSHYSTLEASKYEPWHFNVGYDYSSYGTMPRRVEYRFLKPMDSDRNVGIYEVCR
jgi:hypothetical protein